MFWVQTTDNTKKKSTSGKTSQTADEYNISYIKNICAAEMYTSKTKIYLSKSKQYRREVMLMKPNLGTLILKHENKVLI